MSNDPSTTRDTGGQTKPTPGTRPTPPTPTTRSGQDGAKAGPGYSPPHIAAMKPKKAAPKAAPTVADNDVYQQELG